jgi:hypothetical protein
MEEAVTKRRLATIMAILALMEQFGTLWVFQAVDMAQRPDPNSSDWTAPGHIMLYEIIVANLVLAATLFTSTRRMLPNAWDRVGWTALAMGISPWTTFLLIGLPRPDSAPWQAVALLGIAVPYVFVAASARHPRHPGG